MTKLLFAAVPLVVLVLAGCHFTRLGGSAGAAPDAPPPRIGVRDAPPPAWVETESGSYWLAYSSYCWERTCVDMLAPDEREDLPTIPLRRGETVTFHLGFRAREAVLRFVVVGETVRSVRLDPIVLAWRAGRGGVAWLLTRPARAGGDASYVARFTIS